MKPFKFFQKEKNIDYGEIGTTPRVNSRYNIIFEGWEANRNGLPPGQCPYDIGTPERGRWMHGWSAREDRQPAPLPTEDELFVEMQDINTGEHFGIPAALNYSISYRGRELFDAQRTFSGRCNYGQYEYWIDNVYRIITTEDRLVIDVTIAVPNNTIRDTFYMTRQVISYE